MRRVLAVCFISACWTTFAVAQQADPIVLPTVSYGESDTLYNLALQQYQQSFDISDPNNPFQASEMIQKHGPVVDDINDTNPPDAPAPVSIFTQVSATKPFNAVGLKSFEGPGLGMPGRYPGRAR